MQLRWRRLQLWRCPVARDDPGPARHGHHLIQWLYDQGERKRANDLATILRSLASAREANAQLRGANRQLRRELKARGE